MKWEGPVYWLEWIADEKIEYLLNLDTLEYVRKGQIAGNATNVVYTKREEAARRKAKFGDKKYIAEPNGKGFFYIDSKRTGEMKLKSVTAHMYDYPELLALFRLKTEVEGLEYKNTE
jgi:hypothetical protein